MIISEFMIDFPANESVLALLMVLIPGLWILINLILIAFDALLWFIIIIRNYLTRVLSFRLICHKQYESERKGFPKEIKNESKILFGKAPLDIKERIFILYGLFRNIYIKEMPWKDIIKEIDYIKIDKAIFSNDIRMIFFMKEDGKIIRKESTLSPGSTQRIPKSEDYVISLKIEL